MDVDNCSCDDDAGHGNFSCLGFRDWICIAFAYSRFILHCVPKLGFNEILRELMNEYLIILYNHIYWSSHIGSATDVESEGIGSIPIGQFIFFIFINI